LATGLLACGGEGSDSNSTAGPPGQRETPEESVEGFGEEAAGPRRERILAAERAYLQAIASHDYPSACARLSSRVRESLAAFPAKAGEPKRCEEILPRLLAPSAAAISRRQARGRVSRVRIGGEQALVIFHAPGARLYVFSLQGEGGEWKATRVSASILVPLPAVPE
jgi:hypothetical protein